jgi:urease subunit gamma/beta
MRWLPRDEDKLRLHAAGTLAQKRLWRGLRLNYPEAMALIASQLLECIRDGESVAALMDKGKTLLGHDDVMVGVASLVFEVQVEGTFPDGTKLVTVHDPICSQAGDMAFALYGSGLDTATALANRSKRIRTEENRVENPGEIITLEGDIELQPNRVTVEIEVTNMGDRPIQVGSHYPFFETNVWLRFDRALAFDKRLDIPSGTAARFEPGETRKVRLVTLAGAKRVFGGNGFIMGDTTPDRLAGALEKLQAAGGHA